MVHTKIKIKKNDLDLATSVASILHGSVLQSGLGGWC